MQMMYETIYKALVEVGLEDAFSPQDFLNFYCLGNREAPENGTSNGEGHGGATNTPQVPCFSSLLSQLLLMEEHIQENMCTLFCSMWEYCGFLSWLLIFLVSTEANSFFIISYI